MTELMAQYKTRFMIKSVKVRVVETQSMANKDGMHVHGIIPDELMDFIARAKVGGHDTLWLHCKNSAAIEGVCDALATLELEYA